MTGNHVHNPTKFATALLGGAAVAALLAGCGSSGGGSGGGNAGAGGGGGGASAISVTVDGKAYTATSGDPTCSTGATGKGTFGNQYSDADKKTGLSSLQMIVPDASAAKSGTDSFTLTVTVGPMMSGTNYDISPKDGKGSGTLTLSQSGSTAKVTFTGTAATGQKVSGTLQCNQVLKLG